MAGLENYCTLIITYDIEKLWKKNGIRKKENSFVKDFLKIYRGLLQALIKKRGWVGAWVGYVPRDLITSLR